MLDALFRLDPSLSWIYCARPKFVITNLYQSDPYNQCSHKIEKHTFLSLSFYMSRAVHLFTLNKVQNVFAIFPFLNFLQTFFPFVICSDDCDVVSQMRISNPLPRSSNDTFCLNIRGQTDGSWNWGITWNQTQWRRPRANCAQVCWSFNLLSVYDTLPVPRVFYKWQTNLMQVFYYFFW